ncbi:MAG: aminotransferase class IV, partial [Bacteroidota bacterium]
GVFQTPPLSEGCIDGVMRRQLIGIMNRNGIELREQPLTKADLVNADEILLSNVMNWVRNVTRLGEKSYRSTWGSKFNNIILNTLVN